MKLIIAPDHDSFIKHASQLVLESGTAAVKENDRFTFVLSGGNTPKTLYAHLSDDYYKRRLSWADVHFFFGDERCVPPDHPDSNYKMAKDSFLSALGISAEHIFRMKGEMESPREAAREYQNKIKSFFKIEKSLPKFDLILLGLGEDGHTASLFPGTTALNEKSHLVTANYVEKFSAHRITLTYPVLNNALRVVFLCAGGGKAQVIRDIFRDDLPIDRYPAQRVNPVGGELIWLLDNEAASKLSNSAKEKAIHL